jgi:hypothetical protein
MSHGIQVKATRQPAVGWSGCPGPATSVAWSLLLERAERFDSPCIFASCQENEMGASTLLVLRIAPLIACLARERRIKTQPSRDRQAS